MEETSQHHTYWFAVRGGGPLSLSGQRVRMATAVAISECSVMKLDKVVVQDLLHNEPSFAEIFLNILDPSPFSEH
jgi:hypothetical protein